MSKYKNSLWINPVALKSENCSETLGSNMDGMRRAYDMWECAHRSIINSKGEKNELEQAYIYLDLAFTVVKKELDKEYGFSYMLIDNKNLGFIETLEHFGVTKPLLFKQYKGERNNIVHRDTGKIGLRTAISEAEAFYLFFKLAEYSLMNKRSELHIDKCNKKKLISSLFLRFYTTERIEDKYELNLSIKGCIPPKYLSFEKMDTWIQVDEYEIYKSVTDYKKDQCDLLEDDDIIEESVMLRGKIKNSKLINAYVRNMLNPIDYGGMLDVDFETILSK